MDHCACWLSPMAKEGIGLAGLSAVKGAYSAGVAVDLEVMSGDGSDKALFSVALAIATSFAGRLRTAMVC
jgi:hypothetical protein